MSILMIFVERSILVFVSLSIGANVLHGPHHSAKKSTKKVVKKATKKVAKKATKKVVKKKAAKKGKKK